MAQINQFQARQFTRPTINALIAGGRHLTDALEAFVAQTVQHDTDPALLPFFALQRMGRHPVIYLAERMVTGVIRRPDLYSVSHPDPRIKAETEEWLWPLLPKLLPVYARAFAYGWSPVVFNWGRETLKVQVPTRDGTGTRNRTLQDHTHYTSSHSVRNDQVHAEWNPDDTLDFLEHFGERYTSDRARVVTWDQEFGDWRGQGARQRAWRDYCTCIVLDLLEANYLERSVDNPRIAFAPPGEIEIDGVKVDNAEHVMQIMSALQGSGVAVLPQEFDDDGNQQYNLTTLDLPDREAVWDQAIKRREQRMLVSYLALVGDGITAAAAKTLDGLLKEFVQDIATWVSADLTEIVEQVHCRNHDPEQVPPPEIEATDVGKTGAKKTLTEVLRIVGSEEVAKWTDVPKALDDLGVPVLEQENEDAASAPPPGRPPDLTGAREERREDAITEGGEESVGAPDEGEE